MWKPGDVVALRGIYNQRVSYIQSAVVVQDQPEEVALAVLPGAECFAPEGYIAIDAAKQEVFEKLEKRLYPFDGAWLGWLPDSNWSPPQLPKNWDQV
jgi:hypothetical protein